MNPASLTRIIILTTGVFCFFIAARLGKRQLVDSGEQLAWSAFRIWWLALGLNITVSAVNAIFALANFGLTIYLFFTLGTTLLLCVALWGLLYYLVYLFTGNSSLAWPLAGFYGVVFVSLVAYILLVLRPIGVTYENGTSSLQYASSAPELNILIIALFILLPQLLAALAYFSLFFRVKEHSQRYRILLVSLSIFFWFASPFIAVGLGVSELPWWAVASRLLGLAAVLVIYWAYYPPVYIKRRFGVASI